MSQKTQEAGQTSAESEFGPNQWLVDELREQYRQDPSSVDPSWAEYFASRDVAYQNVAAPPPTTHEEPARPPQTACHAGAAPADPPKAPEPQRASASTHAAKPAENPSPKPPTTQQSVPQAQPAPAPARPAAKEESPVSSTSDRPIPAKKPEPTPARPEPIPPEPMKLRGPAAAVVRNMAESLEVPTATSVRDIPAKLLFDNRIVINNHLRRHRRGKVSFTHLIGYAMIEAIVEMPDMNNGFDIQDGKPVLLRRQDINFGLAIDMPRPDGSRGLVVPSIKSAQTMDFVAFWEAYEDIVRRARGNKLTMADFQGTTVTLTNPGGIGTVHSIPRLMAGQGTIVGVGAMDYPAQFQGASQETLSELAVSRVMTVTSTYDHRIIQGAASGEFLKILADKLLGLDGFYDRVFRSLRLPYEPVRWVQDNPLKDSKEEKFAHVMDLIHAFRVRGHLMADTDPLQYRQRRHPDLDVQTYGLTLWDLDRSFPTRGFGGTDSMPLRSILGLLRDAYCRTIGVEYMHITDPEERLWLQKQFETPRPKLSKDQVHHIMDRLNAAEAFETFLQTKFVGQKRFSLEGGESVIPMLDSILHDASHDDIDEVCIGMAHRGRLNVLSNLAGKSYRQIFQEFEGNQDPKTVLGSGDVKYHLGTEGTYTATDGATTKVYLAANPSHLEAVNPVLEGIARAKQDRLNRGGVDFPVLPILIHGDAAFAGQGVVAETLNLSELRGYRTGGTIHVVINNQIGFTTTPDSSRTSYYCTDIAKSTQLPIFHVNGDDPEACVRVAEIAFRYRQKFRRDVVIDLVCYRRRGHNEGDDPSMTQPEMYRIIETKPSVRKLYTEALIARGDLTEDEAQDVVRNFQHHLEQVFTESRKQSTSQGGSHDGDRVAGLEVPDSQRGDQNASAPISTAVDASVLARIGDAHVSMPDRFTVHPKLRTLMEKRREMSRDGHIDWAFAEILSFGSLLVEGTPVRLAGQDSRRGTFVQRHAVLIDKVDQDTWTPLLHLGDGQARFNVYDSSLSEFAALGFEYGYSVESPQALVLWEAQFGDFVNGAQTIIDEFISASEQKWGQNSSVVLLLPHGYEGQGPDHSSARPERFLQLCAEQNLRVAMPSSPANYFHLLRDQARRRPRRPLIVFTPKSMLRNKAAVSSLDEFTTGGFHPVIEDASADPSAIRQVLLCSGKVYWDLLAHRKAEQRTDTAIIRVEQLYPLPIDELKAALDRYPTDIPVRWVQEEPLNQGAASYMAIRFASQLGRPLQHAARPASASPAAGTSARHKAEQEQLLIDAFAPAK
ncbi:multifunctional oxoglutarate decarboxylase/oxoglutarate dehydrogenase thiamine pyrophosphate-binding subunit/dihydrolipoyllysine-residue succinyltransferase subunit [Devriesea agamarum]|uniref:multifunctional oxoglutarate decarboxylase/oxoglutarate dehydrogenase thiamine pyrophosphate-binding subunit/dihydrolipoyllysine-residue succinyltransferase subunit n=1 Tax=Devriesea agamarum TaxID=472569 RepID=UPI00071D9117|nr:multifunctional oxoglutarate decarboxylase/oxoglutarate dehydrogenase thiamine pyrophosphate-binding subunit/dihydrolipoyllysine-residue succinyltransferase subunit [Devriesea agamarum]